MLSKILPSGALSADRTLEGDAFCPLLEHNHRIVEKNAERHSGECLVASSCFVLDIPSMQSIDEAFGILLSGEEDKAIVDYFIETAFPPEHDAGVVLRALEDAEGGLFISSLEQLCC